MWLPIFSGVVFSWANMSSNFHNYLPFTEDLLWATHFTEHITYIKPLEFHKNTAGQMSLSPSYMWKKNWSLVRFGDLPKIIQLGREDPRAKLSSVRLYSPVFFPCLQSCTWLSTVWALSCCSSVTAKIPSRVPLFWFREPEGGHVGLGSPG